MAAGDTRLVLHGDRFGWNAQPAHGGAYVKPECRPRLPPLASRPALVSQAALP
jgi:hypothetical protein